MKENNKLYSAIVFSDSTERKQKDDFIKQSFKETIKKSGIELEGLVLDLFSGRISIAPICSNKTKVICYELMSEYVNELKGNGIEVIQGNIFDLNLPFRSNVLITFTLAGSQ